MSARNMIDPEWSVHETIRRHPATRAVIESYGMDTCCGGGVSLREAAHRDDIDLDRLRRELQGAIDGATAAAQAGT
jgi:regulator of cell morphogenesis and NO signaling